MPAFAVRDEHPPLRRLQILQPEPDHLANSATRQGPSLRASPGPATWRTAPNNKITSAGSNTFGNVLAGVRIEAPRPLARQHLFAVSPSRGTGFAARSPTQHEPVEQPRHRRQPAADRARGHPRPAIRKTHHPTITSTAPLDSDELEHVRRRHLNRVLVDHREEHPQVRHRRQHRVRPAPRRHELHISGEHLITAKGRTLTQPPTTTTCRSPISHKQTLDEGPRQPHSITGISTDLHGDQLHVGASPSPAGSTWNSTTAPLLSIYRSDEGDSRSTTPA